MWEVTDPAHPELPAAVLFGTHHLASSTDIPGAAWAAFAKADVLVVEAEEGGPGETYDDDQIKRAMELPFGSLMKMLADNDYLDLQHRLGLPTRVVARMRPWVALSQLVKTVFSFPARNIASAIWESAEQRHMKIHTLDTWLEQTVFLDMVVGADDLTGAIRDPQLACSMQSDLDAYLADYDRAFIKRAARGPSTATSETSAIATRETVWTEKLVGLFQEGKPMFVAIGVANIVGPTGIAQRLAQAGYSVRRLR